MRRPVLALFVLAALMWASPAGAATGPWQLVASPDVGDRGSRFTGVAAIAADDVWAVGQAQGRFRTRTLAEHWDGTSWQVVATPNRGRFLDNLIRGVDAASADDVWAVGSTSSESPEVHASRTLAMHWDGSSWSIVPTPNVGTAGSLLQNVSASGPNDVWAVGEAHLDPATGRQANLMLHWDGVAWSVVPAPERGTRENDLYNVDAIAPDDAWAVGFFRTGDGWRGIYRTLALHWNGSSWSVVDTPNVGTATDANSLLAVAGAPGGVVWAAGYGPKGPQLQRWNGGEWRKVAPDPATPSNGFFTSLAVAGRSDIWAAGLLYDGETGDYAPLLEHRDATGWHHVAATAGDHDDATLADVSSAGGNVWAVGGVYRTLVLRHQG